MLTRSSAVLVPVTLAVVACATPPQPRPPAAHETRICVEGSRFVRCGSRAPFVPWGFNYDHDRSVRLIEDYWEQEPATVEEDIREMQALGADVVRIHLQLGRFMRGPGQPDEAALDRLSALLDLAERNGLRVDLTGLAAYRPADSPAWYDDLPEPQRWQVQTRFWRAVAERGARSSAVFAYDLMNEPVVPGDRQPPRGWVHPAALDGLHFIQHIVLDRAGRSAAEIAHAWAELLARAIRDADPRALVTIGMLPSWSGFTQRDVSDVVDFASVHLYPEAGQEASMLETLRSFDLGKPVLVEELAPIHCSVAELERFMLASRGSAAGWLGFYWGKSPSELAPRTTLADALLADWLAMLERVRPEMTGTDR